MGCFLKFQGKKPAGRSALIFPSPCDYCAIVGPNQDSLIGKDKAGGRIRFAGGALGAQEKLWRFSFTTTRAKKPLERRAAARYCSNFDSRLDFVSTRARNWGQPRLYEPSPSAMDRFPHVAGWAAGWVFIRGRCREMANARQLRPGADAGAGGSPLFAEETSDGGLAEEVRSSPSPPGTLPATRIGFGAAFPAHNDRSRLEDFPEPPDSRRLATREPPLSTSMSAIENPGSVPAPFLTNVRAAGGGARRLIRIRSNWGQETCSCRNGAQHSSARSTGLPLSIWLDSRRRRRDFQALP